MRRLLLFCLFAFTTLMATAQHEQDFAGHFMKLYANGTSLVCSTISPAMLENMMKNAPGAKDDHTQQMIKRLKSIRLVTNTNKAETQDLTDKAFALINHNTQRYQAYGSNNGKKGVWMRKKGGVIVEIVLINGHSPLRLHIVNLTGNMDDAFIDQLTSM